MGEKDETDNQNNHNSNSFIVNEEDPIIIDSDSYLLDLFPAKEKDNLNSASFNWISNNDNNNDNNPFLGLNSNEKNMFSSSSLKYNIDTNGNDLLHGPPTKIHTETEADIWEMPTNIERTDMQDLSFSSKNFSLFAPR